MALFNLFSWSKKMEEGTAAACARPAERRTSSTCYNSDVRISYYLLEKPRQCCTPGCRNRAPAKIGRDRVGSKKGEG